MGITAADPPPWLRRMKRLGYPPGWLLPPEGRAAALAAGEAARNDHRLFLQWSALAGLELKRIALHSQLRGCRRSSQWWCVPMVSRPLWSSRTCHKLVALLKY